MGYPAVDFRKFIKHIPDELEDLIKQYDHQFLYYDNNLFVLYIEPVFDDDNNRDNRIIVRPWITKLTFLRSYVKTIVYEKNINKKYYLYF